jgi:uncharacterized protein (DUF1501 family)
MSRQVGLSRRDFVRATAGLGAAVAAPAIVGAQAKGTGKRFKIGLVGCGGRGNGAVADAFEAMLAGAG